MLGLTKKNPRYRRFTVTTGAHTIVYSSVVARWTKAPPVGESGAIIEYRKSGYDDESDGRCEMSGFVFKGHPAIYGTCDDCELSGSEGDSFRGSPDTIVVNGTTNAGTHTHLSISKQTYAGHLY